MDIKTDVTEKASKAKTAARKLAVLSTLVKNAALMAMANRLVSETQTLISANEKDLGEAGRQGLSSAMIDRLTLNPQRISEMAAGFREVAALPDLAQGYGEAYLPS